MPYILDVNARKLVDFTGEYLEVNVILESGVSSSSKCLCDTIGESIDRINTILAPALVGRDIRNTQVIDDIISQTVIDNKKVEFFTDETFTTSLACIKTKCVYENLRLYEVIGGVSANTIPNLILVKNEKLYQCKETLSLDNQVRHLKENINVEEVNFDDFTSYEMSQFVTVMDLIDTFNGHNTLSNVLLVGTDSCLADIIVGLKIQNMICFEEYSEDLQELFRIKDELSL